MLDNLMIKSRINFIFERKGKGFEVVGCFFKRSWITDPHGFQNPEGLAIKYNLMTIYNYWQAASCFWQSSFPQSGANGVVGLKVSYFVIASVKMGLAGFFPPPKKSGVFKTVVPFK